MSDLLSLLYVTADRIGTPTGGGVVTFHESEALKTLGPCEVLGREQLECDGPDPWKWDERLHSAWAWNSLPTKKYLKGNAIIGPIPKLCHLYAGTFGKTVANLKARETIVTHTVAAHDRFVSRREHERLGVPFPYPHLIQEDLWQRYIEGYRLADVIVCPSTVAAKTVRDYGPDFAGKRIEVIPHGCTLPEKIMPLPRRFVLGYLGSFGVDKGVVYLLQAWKKLSYKDALLILAGADSTSPWVRQMIEVYGGWSIYCMGWVRNVSDFYNSISCLCQPSVTEGFGCEVVEALAHGRPVICSEGAGAMDVVYPSMRFRACDVDDLVRAIQFAHDSISRVDQDSIKAEAEKYTWGRVREQYISLWKGLLL